MSNRYFLDIAFNGSNYHGWQIQPESVTVQEVLNKHISIILGERICCIGCGRTDSGVHALKYFAHFDTIKILDDSFRKKLDRFLPLDIKVKNIYLNTDKIHARFDALERSYKYILSKGKTPFSIHQKTITYSHYDVSLINEACQLIIGSNDFETFSKGNNNHNHYICHVTKALWTETEDEYIFEITANRFVRSMIRMLTGTLIDVGRNKISIEEFRKIFESKDRTRAGKSVSPEGLYFTDVVYPEGKLILLDG